MSSRGLFLLNAAVLGLLAAGLAAAAFIPPGPFLHQGGLADRIFDWDALWYRDIALHGYHWNPAVGTLHGHNQNIAFFPLFPLLEAFVAALVHPASPTAFILLGLIFGLWSNFAFHRLARLLLDGSAARHATILFALWPAACFLTMGYPTGLINLCVISCLRHQLAEQRWRAALWCGLGTAAAPTIVFAAAALCAVWARERLHGRLPGGTAALIGLAGASVSGLILFMLYQQAAFGDALAFNHAQSAFVTPEPPVRHILRLFNPLWYLLPAIYFAHELYLAAAQGLTAADYGRAGLNVSFQFTLNVIAVFMVAGCLLAPAGRRLPLAVQLAGWFTLAGYMWFMATTYLTFVNGLRMLYPAAALFLVLGGAASTRRRAAITLRGIFALLLVVETALAASGYGVI